MAPHWPLHMASPALFDVAPHWSAAEGYFFCRSLYEAFSATLNGTIVRAYRADSCFVELVYNVW